MGIPSFYRHLCRRFPGVVGPGPYSDESHPPAWLCLDFNCAMYYVLRKMPALQLSVATWERDFQKAIADYMTEIILMVKPTVGVYVSCDGVVCAAKRRQQRLRRFKGPWMHALEQDVRKQAGVTIQSDEEKWDQNALTPGTRFMAALSVVLKNEAARLSRTLNITVTVSDTEEAGEGEHKLMTHMRKAKPVSCAIYGLDADLILLALILEADTDTRVTLVRETQEFEGGGSSGSSGGSGSSGSKSQWRHLDVAAMRKALLGSEVSNPQVRDFVAGMSLLGNDFLPRSLTRTVRDDGIPTLIAGLRALWKTGDTLIGPSGSIQTAALRQIMTGWAASEEGDLIAAVRAANKHSRYPPGIGASPEETALKEFQSQPTVWCSIRHLAVTDGSRLKPDWRRIYMEDWGSVSHADVVNAYIQGLAWVWDYYSGRPVDLGWSYDAHLPPLWSDISAYLTDSTQKDIAAPALKWPTPLPSWVHLLSVLPAASVEQLLPDHRSKLESQDWWWPTSWRIFDVGRSQLWECEPVIPVIPEAVLREWVAAHKIDGPTVAAAVQHTGCQLKSNLSRPRGANGAKRSGPKSKKSVILPVPSSDM